MGNGWSNFTHTFSDFGKGIWDGITGNTEQASRDFANYVNDGHNLDYGNAFGTGREYSPEEIAQEQAKQQAIARSTAFNPNSAWNKGNWQSISASVRNAHYGSQAGNSSVTPPSQVMAISNPGMKTAIASSRGTNRSILQTVSAVSDTRVAGVFKNPSLPLATPPSSEPPASGTGGTMPSTSLDEKPQA